jgi:hypothetical protein
VKLTAEPRPSPAVFWSAVSHHATLAGMKRLAPIVLAAALSVSASGCYGSYGASRTLHRWNGQATGSKLANGVIHFGLYVIPVYELCWLGDFFIFNNLEFLTGNQVFK